VTPALWRRLLTATAGFLVTVLVGGCIPLLILFVAPVAVGDGAGWPFGLLVKPAGFLSAALVWLVVVAGGLWLGIRHPDHGFFRGAFLGSFIVLGCVVIVLIAHLVGKLA